LGASQISQRCPVLILTRDSAIGFLNALSIAPLTSTIRDIPTEVYLTPAEGMPSDCAVNLDNLQIVPKVNLGPLISTLSSGRMEEVKQAISFALGFDSLLS